MYSYRNYKVLLQYQRRNYPAEIRWGAVPALWGKYVYNGGNCVGYNDKIHQLFKGGNIKKQGVKVYSHQKDKPKIIRENEKFAKRNFCVKSHLNGVVIK